MANELPAKTEEPQEERPIVTINAPGLSEVLSLLFDGRITDWVEKLRGGQYHGQSVTRAGLRYAAGNLLVRGLPRASDELAVVADKWFEELGGQVAFGKLLEEVGVQDPNQIEDVEAVRAQIQKRLDDEAGSVERWRERALLSVAVLRRAISQQNAEVIPILVAQFVAIRAAWLYLTELEPLVWRGYSLSDLEGLLIVLKANRSNGDEGFWQRTLSERAFVLSQILGFPILHMRGKSYVGGKRLDNSGGKLADYVVVAPYTRNVAIVEIKTPTMKLLRKDAYRDDIFGPSEELAGALVQVGSYKQTLLEDLANINLHRREDEPEIFPVDPPRVIIIGSLEMEQMTKERRRSFEIFRTSVKDTKILTYDELLGLLEGLIKILNTE